MSIADRTGHPVRETRRTTNTFPVLMRRNHPIDRRSATQRSVTRNNVIARRIPTRDDLLAHRVTQPGLLRLILLERNDLLTALRLQVIVTDEAAINRLVDPRGYAVGTFGDDIFAHPLSVFFILVGLSLLALRVILARPVPEVIPDRALMLGCALGLAMFLTGNFVTAHGLLLP